MKKPTVVQLTDSQFRELRFAVEQSLASGFLDIASALAESLRPIVADAGDGDPLPPSENGGGK